MPSGGDIVETAAASEGFAKPPLLVLDRVRAFLDEHGLGSGDAARAPDRRRWRVELHLPARARGRSLRSPASSAAAACRRPRTMWFARPGSSSRCVRLDSRACRRSSRWARTRASSASRSTSWSTSTVTFRRTSYRPGSRTRRRDVVSEATSSTRWSRSTRPTSPRRGSRRSRGPGATTSVRSGASHSSGTSTRRARSRPSSAVGAWLADNLPEPLP